MQTSAKVIADSINLFGDRCTTMEVNLHRFVLAELNTHRVFSRNSASSRAIPVTKQLKQVWEHPAFPVEWPAEKPGMQGGEPLTGKDLIDARDFWATMTNHTVDAVQQYMDDHPEVRLHKSLLNRWLEPAMWHRVIITSTEWQNFFNQRSTRYSPLAQPEIARAANLMLAALEESEPAELVYGDWHLPYIDEDDWAWVRTDDKLTLPPREALKRVSVARCARVSYLNHDGSRDPYVDLEFFLKLVSASPMHASPLEHVAACHPDNRHEVTLEFYDGKYHKRITRMTPRIGNLMGFMQMRALYEN